MLEIDHNRSKTFPFSQANPIFNSLPAEDKTALTVPTSFSQHKQFQIYKLCRCTQIP